MLDNQINLRSYLSLIETIKELPDKEFALVVYLEYIDDIFKNRKKGFYESEKYAKNIIDRFNSKDALELMEEDNIDKDKMVTYFLKGNSSHEKICIDILDTIFKQSKKFRPELVNFNFINKYNNLKKEYTKIIDDFNTKFEAGYFDKE